MTTKADQIQWLHERMVASGIPTARAWALARAVYVGRKVSA